MKKLLFIIGFTMISLLSSAQFSVDAGVGYSTKKAVTSELNFSYNTDIAFVKAGSIVQLSNEVAKGVLINAVLGHNIKAGNKFEIQPAVGYAYNLNSNDNKSLNSWGFIYNLNTYVVTTENSRLGVSLNYYPENNIFVSSISMRYIF